MHVGTGGLRETLKKIFGQLGLEIAYQFCGYFRADYAMGAASEIDRCSGESFIHGHQEIAGTQNAFLISQRLIYGFSEGNAGVFDGVMLIHVEIADGAQVQVECAMARDKVQHVVKKTNARGHLRFAVAIEAKFQADVGLVGFAVDVRGSGHQLRKRSF
jgi:hypothetical protein